MTSLRLITIALCSSLLLLAGDVFEDRAIQLSRDVIDRHIPYGTVLNPMYMSVSSDQLVTYTRCGDSAIWTGHWLAGEAFRYKVTGSPEALDAVRQGIAGLRLLVEVTGANVLSRCALRADSPWAAGPVQEERGNGIYNGQVDRVAYRWVGHTSRDQYLGAFFGLSVAYENLADQPVLRTAIRDLVTRMLDRLLSKGWAIVMPDGDISTVFWLRPDQELALLQVGRQVNGTRFARVYEDLRRSAGGLKTIMSLEASDPYGSYYKFNLAAITWYILIHNEEASSSMRNTYLDAYSVFREAVRSHGNAFFNVVDRAIRGSDAVRDAETVRLLSEWLKRPLRDLAVDLRSKYTDCGENRACQPIPVPERVTTDFLWQRSPFQLVGGGVGQIESPGIDFTLPYWMARACGGISPAAPAAVSAASTEMGLAPDSIASLFGTGFIDSSRIIVRDSAGSERTAEVFYGSDKQINFAVPGATVPGHAVVRVIRPDGSESQSASVQIETVAPALFSANSSGKGPPAATAIQTTAGGNFSPVAVFECTGAICLARPLRPEAKRPVYLSLFGTGFRHSRKVRVTFAGQELAVEYAGPQGQFSGLDQINLRVETGLHITGEQDVVLVADDVTSNPVRIFIE